MNRAKRIGKNIRYHRNFRNLTQMELASKAGVHYTFVGHIERGSKFPSIETLLDIAKALRTMPSRLLVDVR